jgi:hypothetical protein
VLGHLLKARDVSKDYWQSAKPGRSYFAFSCSSVWRAINKIIGPLLTGFYKKMLLAVSHPPTQDKAKPKLSNLKEGRKVSQPASQTQG